MCNETNKELTDEGYWKHGHPHRNYKNTRLIQRDVLRLNQAMETSKQSKCVKHSVGCIITNVDNRIVGEGYNGTPDGHENCDEHFPTYKGIATRLDAGDGALSDHVVGMLNAMHHKWSTEHEIHAEMNALMYSDRSDRIGGTLYTTHQPCENCAKHIAASGVARVVYAIPYERADTERTIEMFKTSKIEFIHLSLGEHND